MSQDQSSAELSATAETPDLVAVVGARPSTATGVRGLAIRAVTSWVDVVSHLIDRTLGEGAPWAYRAPGRRVAIGWVVSRLVMLALLALPEQTIIDDVSYYFHNLQKLSATHDLSGALHEYPLPVILLVGLPYLAAFGNMYVYNTLFVVMMLGIDLAFCRLLFRQGGRRQTSAVTLWLAAGPMMGPLAVTRFDLVPGVLAGAAVLLLATRPRLATLFVAAGAAIKLWPAMLLPALATPRRTRWRVVTTAVAAAVVIVAFSVAIGGVDRLLSPLAWQSDRGLQIESVAAIPLMLAWSVFHEPWVVLFTKYVTSQVYGPGGAIMLKVSTLATAVGFLAIAALWLRAWRRGSTIDPKAVGWIVLTTTGMLVLTNKVFSPQYLLWLSPIAIAMVSLSPRTDTGVRRFSVLLLSVGVLTQLIYPVLYLWVSDIYWANPVGVLMLLARDVALVGFVVYSGRRAWLATAAAEADALTPGAPS